MVLDTGSLGSFGDLATALGLVTAGGPNSAWFEDPVHGGTPADGHGLAHLMADPEQRDALLRFVDSVLGPPEALDRGDTRWVPLFQNVDPTVTVYAVVDPVPDQPEVRLGIGVEHTTQGGPPSVSTRLHVPLFRFAERGQSLGGGDVPWLLLGRDGGEIELGVDATIMAAPPPGTAGLGGVATTIRVPTHADGALGFALTLRDLQLPGASSPRTFEVDADSLDAAGLAELGTDVLDLLTGLVRAQADALADDPDFRPFAALAGMLGLREVDDLPPLPLADLPTRGAAAIVEWVQTLLTTDSARDAWLGELADLLGDDADADPTRDAVSLTVGPLVLTLGLRVETGPGGHPVLVPWVEAALTTRAGAPVVARAVVDLVRVDTGTGAATAVPDVRVEAELGSRTSRLIGTSAGSDPRVDSLRIGLGLDPARQPVFRLTAHGVKLPGAAEQDVLDLSSPDAALDAGAAVLTSALTNALDALGATAAPLVRRLLGLDSPIVTGLDAGELLTDPLGALADYWARLVSSAPAMADVLGHLARLVAGETLAPLPQDGTREDPWRFELEDPLFLEVWSEGTALHVDLVLSAGVPVLGDQTSTTDLTLGLLTLDPTAHTVDFVQSASLSSSLARTDGAATRLAVGDLGLVFDRLGVALAWSPTVGLRPELTAAGLALDLPTTDVRARAAELLPVPLPRLDPATGRLEFAAPEWDAVEGALSVLVHHLAVPELDALLRLLGWDGRTGARLSLSGLLGADPAAAVEGWLADLVLDCAHVRTALGPVAALLSGFSLHAPLGTGNVTDPYRCPVTGDPRAPGLRVWLDPGCAVTAADTRVDLSALLGTEPPDPEVVVRVLAAAGRLSPDLADLLVGRDSLATGLQELLDRWRDTDGLVARPDSLPDGVEGHTLGGVDYATLVALGGAGQLAGEVLDPLPAAVVHVGCEESWLADKPAGTTFDLTASPVAAAAVPDDPAGTWFVRLPTPAEARTARPDLGDVGAQVALLTALLGPRSAGFVLIGYGAAGAATVRYASTDEAVTAVVTVGSPWGELRTDALSTGLGGDALRLLTRLDRPGRAPLPEELAAFEQSPLQRMQAIVDRAAASLDPPALPGLAAETRRTGLPVHAVFGGLDDDTLGRGLGAFVADAVTARLDARVTTPPAAATALHAALDLPVIDLDLGGLLVGAGVSVELLRLGRSGDGLEASVVRGVVVDLHLGVHDGWLVGGPGSTSGAGDLRWLSVRVEVPLDGTEGDCELVAHEITGLGVDRESWVVRVDPLDATAGAVGPEVQGLLSAVQTRLSAASPDLAGLLTLLGLRRDGGLDLAALDRLLLDTAATLRAQVAAAPAEIAAHLRALVTGATGSGSGLTWTVGPASVRLDLGTGALGLDLDLDTDGLLPVHLGVDASAAVSVSGPVGWAQATLTLGEHDPRLGGGRLVASTPAAPGDPVTAVVELAVPGRAVRSFALWPDPDVDALADLAALQLPALGVQALGQALLTTVSDAARPLLLEALEVLGLLRDSGGGFQSLHVPLAAVADPAAWIVAVAQRATTAPAAAAVTLLDALAAVVVPDRGADPGWPLVDGVALDYALEGDRLRLTLAVDLELALDAGTTVTTHLEAGALLGTTTPPVPVLEAAVSVDGRGVEVRLDPDLRVSLLRAPPSDPLPLYPEGPGVGDALGAAIESLLPLLLNQLAGLAGNADAFKSDVGELVAGLGDALALRQGGSFTSQRIAGFADDPAVALVTALPGLVTAVAPLLVEALDPGHVLVALAPSPPPGQVTVVLGSGDSVSLTLISGATPALELTASWDIPDVGTVAVESLRVSAAGVVVAARLGPIPVEAGPVVLRPVLTVRAGSAATDDRLLSLGLALDDDAVRSVEVRWTLDAQPPILAGVTRSPTGAVLSVSEPDGPFWLLSLGLGLVGGVVVDALGPGLLTARVQTVLDGVLFDGGTTIDSTLALDLLDPEALLTRLERLLWNAADEGISVEIADAVTIGLVADGSATDAMLGVNLSLAPGKTFDFPTSGVKVSIEVDDTWLLADVPGGLSVFGVHATRTGDDFTFELEPGVAVAGLGVRFTNQTGPLLDLGIMSLDGIALHTYAEAGPTGVGGGVQLELAGFSFAPSAGAGGNSVANGMVNDAGAQSSPSTRPSFSPAFAVQQQPGETSPSLTLRAGKPPGPWWLLVQRQLGPLYLERVGFDSREAAGRITRVSLLFDGRVEIFGLTAAVDQLSLNYTVGGDIFDADSWSVDLMGLAISADMGGVVLAGGLLKTVVEGNPGYVGMLLGRFGIYGLSVFGGYTSLDGDPSFFVFGAVNGPIGGPPAFFITGLGGGLGINRKLVVPDDPRLFPDYPFIMALDPYADVGDPMQRLRELNEYFPPELGTFWFAGGISFTCFSLVDGIAVLAVSFGNAGLDINLLGLARMALPNPAAALVSIELGLLARFSTSEGVFMIRAALTDNSWLLYEDVRLTGGFAFAFWWKGPLAGQFVLTIGGYHPDFHRDGYPDVPRLGICWQVSDDIVIKGESFFALTSEALMAGVSVTAIADFGWAWARASFGAQALVYFDPFWFTAEAWAQVSAGIEIDTWLFGTISISITVGARVQVQGPEFSGKASVEVGPCTVTIPFGSQQEKDTPVLDWTGFVPKYLEETSPGHARALSGITGHGTLAPATGGAVSTPTPDGSAGRPFEVFSEFEITFTTTVPTRRFDVGGAAETTVSVRRSDGAAATLGLKPMRAGNLDSLVQIRLSFFDQETDRWVDDPDDLGDLAEHSTVTTGSFPMGVWTAPSSADSAAAPALPTGDIVNAGNQVQLAAVAKELHPGPTINYYTVEAGRRPLPLRQPTGTDRPTLLDLGGSVVLPVTDTVDTALRFAEARLFGPEAAPVPGGPMQHGRRSNVARAAYRRDVSAPPLAGTLTDGLAVADAADADVAIQKMPTPQEVPEPRAPRVIGYLAGGSGVAARRSGTTVADGSVKRRPAPTLTSVHARLGRQLPIGLEVQDLPAVKTGRTVTPAALPFTAVAGSARSFGLGSGPAADRVIGLSGLGGPAPKAAAAKRSGVAKAARAGSAPPTLISGDVVVLHSQDHAADQGERRPTLDLNGAGRVTALRGDGHVLVDAVLQGPLSVPPGSELVIVQADGSVDVVDGLAGWHTRSRVVAVGSGTGIGPGCVLDVEASTTELGVTWTTAGEIVRGAGVVTTRFARPVTALVVVIESDDPERVGELGLELTGATRAVGADTGLVEPALLMNGNQSIAVYPVVPEPAEPGVPPEPVAVRVVAGGGWRVTGILGAAAPLDEVVAGLRRHGVAAAGGRMLATEGPGCTPQWQAAAITRRRRGRR